MSDKYLLDDVDFDIISFALGHMNQMSHETRVLIQPEIDILTRKSANRETVFSLAELQVLCDCLRYLIAFLDDDPDVTDPALRNETLDHKRAADQALSKLKKKIFPEDTNEYIF